MSNTCSDSTPGCSAKGCKTRNVKHLVICLQTRPDEMAWTVKVQETMDKKSLNFSSVLAGLVVEQLLRCEDRGLDTCNCARVCLQTCLEDGENSKGAEDHGQEEPHILISAGGNSCGAAVQMRG